MTMVEEPSPRRYRFGPREHAGPFGSVGWDQIFVVASALLAALVVLRCWSGEERIGGAIVIVIGAVALSCWQVAGRTPLRWLAPLSRFGTDAAFGRHRTRALSHNARGGPVPMRPLLGLALVGAVSGDQGEVGVVVDRMTGTESAALVLAGEGFSLLDEAGRGRIADAWAALLSGIAARPGAVERLSWIERTVPEQGVGLLESAGEAFAAPTTTALQLARASYLALLDGEIRGALRHEALLVVSVRDRRSGRVPSDSRAVVDAIADLERECRRTGLGVQGVLGREGLSRYLGRGFSPTAAVLNMPGLQPIASEECWDALRLDGLWRATYWVSEWPNRSVGGDFLLPFLLAPSIRREVALTMAALPPDRALRRAERARTAKASDADLRRRHGFAPTARAERETEAVLHREAELASGHGVFRFNGYVGVSAVSREELELSCTALERSAAASRLVLRRLYGSQLAALACVLPTGRGL